MAEQLKQERGMTAKMIVDNGPEFLSRVVDQWAYENGVEFHFIEPGKPTQNAYFESFIAGGYCPVTQLTRAVESDPRRDYEFPVIRRLSDAGNDGPGAISRDISSCRISCHSFFLFWRENYCSRSRFAGSTCRTRVTGPTIESDPVSTVVNTTEAITSGSWAEAW